MNQITGVFVMAGLQLALLALQCHLARRHKPARWQHYDIWDGWR